MCGELALFGGDLALLKKPACVPPPCTASLVLRDNRGFYGAGLLIIT